jgi:hypothetical protein
MTPLQSATESSRMPKSVMKTTVGGDATAGGCDTRGLAARSKAANHNTEVRADFAADVNAIRIKSISPNAFAGGAPGVPARLDPSTSLRAGSRDGRRFVA